MDPRPPTIRDIAAATRLSATTVSLALRNHPRISAATKARVEEAARRMNYRPNPTVVSIMTDVRLKKSPTYRETLGWINASDRSDFFHNKKLDAAGYSRCLWQGAQECAERLGYLLEVFWIKGPQMSGRRMTEILTARGIRGLLIPPLPHARGHLSIDWRGFAVTALSHTVARPHFHRVVPDHHYNMQLVLRTLQRKGYQKIGLLIPRNSDLRLDQRLSAAYYLYQQNLPSKRRAPILFCDKDFEKSAASWLARHRPDAVVTVSPYLRLRDIDIGDPAYSGKLGIALMGRSPNDEGFIAALDENPFHLGVTAVNHLAGQLRRNECGIPEFPETIMIKGTLVES